MYGELGIEGVGVCIPGEGREGGRATLSFLVSWTVEGDVWERQTHHLRAATGGRRVGCDSGGFGVLRWGRRGGLFSVRLRRRGNVILARVMDGWMGATLPC